MKNILLNVIYRQEQTKKNILEIINKCHSQNYNVDITIWDYSLEKDAFDLAEAKSSVNYMQLDYEDLAAYDKKIVQLTDIEKYIAVIDLDSLVIPEDGFIDKLNIDILEDHNYGAVYSDFYSKLKAGEKVYIYQKSIPLVSNAIPLVAFSVENYIKNVNEENVKSAMLSSLISKHIPEALCCVLND